MKTKELLDKYRKLLCGLLGHKEPLDLKFYTVKGPINYYHINYTLADKYTKEIAEIKYFEPEKDEQGNETGKKIECTMWVDWSEGQYIILLENELVAAFELYKLPHCCAIIVSCKAYVGEKFRNKRIGTTMNMLRQDIGRLLGYSCMMCTDIEQNKHQRQLLKTNGWNDIHSVRNKRTNNLVYVSVINL